MWVEFLVVKAFAGPLVAEAALKAVGAAMGGRVVNVAWDHAADAGRMVRDALCLSVELRPLTEPEKTLAWSLYVELSTRILVVPMADDVGSDREALSSIYAAFGQAREAIIASGPTSSTDRNDPGTPLAVLVAAYLNVVLRPFLANWHLTLQRHEATRPDGTSAYDHEQAWTEHAAFRDELRVLQKSSISLVRALEKRLELPALASLVQVGPLPEFVLAPEP